MHAQITITFVIRQLLRMAAIPILLLNKLSMNLPHDHTLSYAGYHYDSVTSPTVAFPMPSTSWARSLGSLHSLDTSTNSLQTHVVLLMKNNYELKYQV